MSPNYRLYTRRSRVESMYGIVIGSETQTRYSDAMNSNTQSRRKAKSWRLVADETEVWTGNEKPNQSAIDGVARSIEARGWNGTTIDLFAGDKFSAMVTPSWVGV